MIELTQYGDHQIKSGNHVAEYILLHQSNEFEVIEKNLVKGALIICRTDETADNLNFYYIVSGCIIDSDSNETYCNGATLRFKDLDKAMIFEVLEDTKMIWTTHKPLYDKLHLENQAIIHLLDSIQKKDAYTKEHSLRVTAYARTLAKLCGLNGREIYNIVMGALSHDLGKIEIEDAILNKPGKLTSEEFEIIKGHVQHGYNRANQHLTLEQAAIVYSHHERLDGSGYPRGLKGAEIPEGAKLLAVVDSYDAMSSDRPYRKGMAVDIALAELRAGIGTLYKKIYVDEFCDWIENEINIATQVV